nr:hypothetical protein [Streptomyces sp. H51]
MGRGVRTAVIGGVFAVLVGGAGYGAYNLLSALNGDGGTTAGAAAPARTGPPDADEVGETTGKFFAAWEKGRAAEAATYTNDAAAAEPLLTAYADDAHIGRVRITPGRADGATGAGDDVVRGRVQVARPATARGLPASTVRQLRAVMNRTATSGTAAGVTAGPSGGIGAKTGSAEADGQARSDSRFTGYRDDVAAAATAQDGGHGTDAAAPIVAAVLRTGG